jgi:hypothetical protein
MSFSQPQTSATSTQSLPTNIPGVISPGDTKPKLPNTREIQIGFLYPLNYVFVAKNPTAAQQIFTYLPQALAEAVGLSTEAIQMVKLVPYNTVDRWGYITTIAKINYPETLIDRLIMDLTMPNSGIYQNKDPIVRNLAAQINPKITIFGQVADEDSTTNSGGDTPGQPGPNDTFDNGGDDQQSSSQKATTAGIAVGAVGLSVMYGAAMFIVARRYKRKRQHRRASSMGSSQVSEMRYTDAGSPAMMGGALMSREFSSYGGAAGGRNSHGSGRSGMGGSVRTAAISAPVAAENSLGWN